MTSLISVNQNIVVTAYQIFDFIQTSNTQYFDNSSIEAKFIVKNIVVINLRSVKIRRFITAEFRITRNFFIHSSTFSSKWVIDRFRFKINVNRFVVTIKTYRFINHYVEWCNVNQQTSSFISLSRDDIVTSNRSYSIDATSDFSFSKTSRRDVRFQSSSDLNEFKLFWLTIEDALRDEFSSNYVNFNLVAVEAEVFSFSNFIIVNFSKATSQQSFVISSFTIDMTDNWQNIDFSKQQWNALQTLINDRSDVSNSQEERKSSESVDTIMTDITIDAWNSQEIDYFDLFYDNKTFVIDDDMKHFDKNIFFRDVHNFIDRIKNIVIIKDDKLVRNNLYTCFKDHVFKWWNSIFIFEQKRLIKLSEDIEEWKAILFKRWKQSITSVATTLKEINYTMNNVRKKREFMKYALKIIRVVKIINMSIFSQIIFIYIDLKLKFQRDIIKSIEITTMNMCLQELNDNKKL